MISSAFLKNVLRGEEERQVVDVGSWGEYRACERPRL